jgi:hypothetical protein
MSDAATEHRLEGLEPDNLLAFLALLGLLRALEDARPSWRPRVRWSSEDGPLRPCIRVSPRVAESEFVDAAAEGIRRWGLAIQSAGKAALGPEVHRIEDQIAILSSEENLREKEKSELKKLRRRLTKFQQPEAEYKLPDLAKNFTAFGLINATLHAVQDSKALQVVAATTAQAVNKDGKLIVAPTPLKFSSGQQAFVGTMIKVCAQTTAKALQDSLFNAWTFRHRGDSLRMSPQEARWYSLCASDPTERTDADDDDVSGDGIAPSELGANTLASLGLLSFPVPAMRSPKVASGLEERGEPMIGWPVYNGKWPLSLSAMEHILVSGRDIPDVTWFDAKVFLLNPDLATSKYKNVSYGVARVRPTP